MHCFMRAFYAFDITATIQKSIIANHILPICHTQAGKEPAAI
jgi:hypothetical protein